MCHQAQAVITETEQNGAVRTAPGARGGGGESQGSNPPAHPHPPGQHLPHHQGAKGMPEGPKALPGVNKMNETKI